MATVEQRLVFVISARDDNVSRVTRAVQKAVEDAAKSTEAGGRRMGAAFGNLGSALSSGVQRIASSVFNVQNAIAGIAGAGLLKRAADEAISFDTGLRKIASIMGETEKIEDFEASIRKVSLAFGQTHADVAKANYDLVSSGFDKAATSASVLEASARLAVAGVSTIDKTALLLARTLNGFGMSADGASHAADVLFQTVKLGIIEVPELAEHFAVLGPFARLAGVSFEEVNAAIASLTAGGIPAAEAITALNRLLSGMAAPTTEAGEALTKVGFKLTEIGEDGRERVLPLLDVLRQFRGLDLRTVEEFFPNIRAVKALGVLTENFKQFEGNYSDFVEKAKTEGVADAAFATIAEGTGLKIAQLKSALEEMLIEFGRGFIDEIVGPTGEIISNIDMLKAKAAEAGNAVGSVIKVVVKFVSEWHEEIVLLVEAYVALRAAAVAAAAFDAIGDIVKSARKATAALTEMGLASAATKAGLVGLALAAAYFIGDYLGEAIGKSVSNLEGLRLELARVTDAAADAAAGYESSFADALGIASDEAKRMADGGLAVLNVQTEQYSLRTGKALETAEEIRAAMEDGGIGVRVLGGEFVKVAEAARDAARAFQEAGGSIGEATANASAIAAELGIADGIAERLPASIIEAYGDVGKELEEARTQLSAFQTEQAAAEERLAAAREAMSKANGVGMTETQRAVYKPSAADNQLMGELDVLEKRAKYLRNAVISAEKALNKAETRQKGIKTQVQTGVKKVAEEDAEAKRLEEERERQLRIRKQLEDTKAEIGRRRREADQLAKLRQQAADAYAKATMRESAVLVYELGRRLEAVKAFASDAGAAAARANVVGTVIEGVTDATRSQLEDKFSEAASGFSESVTGLSARIRTALENGLDSRDAIGLLDEGLYAVEGRLGVLRVDAEEELRAAKTDLQAILSTLGDGLVSSGRATQEVLDAIAEDPFDSAAWAASAGLSVDAAERIKVELADYIKAAQEVDTRTGDLDAKFNALSVSIDRDASAAIRGLVSDLGDLQLAQLRVLYSTLDANDALQASARALVLARVQTLEQAEAVESVSRSIQGLEAAVVAGKRFSGFIAHTSNLVSQLKGQDAAKLFGEIGDALQDSIGRLDNSGFVALFRVIREAKQSVQALQEAGAPVDLVSRAEDLGKASGEEIRKRILAAGSSFAADVGSAALMIGRQLVSWVAQIVQFAADSDRVVDFLNEIVVNIPNMVRNIAKNISTIVARLVDAIPNIASSIVEAIPDVVSALADGLPTVVDAVLDKLPDLIDAVLAGVTDAVDKLTTQLQSAVTKIVATVVDALPQLAGSITSILERSSDLIPDVVAGIVDIVVKGLPAIISAVFEALPTVISNVLDGVSELVSGIVRLLTDSLPRIITGILSAVPDIITELIGGVSRIVDVILTELLPALPKIVMGIISSVLLNIPDIVIALVEGIASLAGNIVSSLVTGLVASIPELIREFRIHLPIIITALVAELLLIGPRLLISALAFVVQTIVDVFTGQFDFGAFIDSIFGGVADMLAESFAGVFESWDEMVRSFNDLWWSIEAAISVVGDWWEGVKAWIAQLWVDVKETVSIGDTESTDSAEGKPKVWEKQWWEDAGDAIGDTLGFQFGGVVPRYSAQFGNIIPGMGNDAVGVLAHAGEGFLQRPAVRFVGGPSGVESLNRGVVPAAMRREPRVLAAAPTIRIEGPVFARDAGSVVDDLTYRNLVRGNGRTGRLLGTRYGSMPGQRRG